MIGLEILKNRIKDAPQSSGVYLFKNKKDNPIYIGKAINIKRRLSNYGNLPKLPRRLQKMVSQTVNIDFELTESERNALLLEALLIKKFSPRYNIRLKDDKSFPLIKITKSDFPRLTRFRNEFSNEDKVFGPFTSALKTDKVIKILQKSFKLRSCSDLEFKNRKRARFLFLNSKSLQLLNLKDFCKIFMTLSVFNAEVNGPNTLSSLENSFLNLVSLGKSLLVILINGKLLSSFKRILYLGENFLISRASNNNAFLSDSVNSKSIFTVCETIF